MYIAAISVTWWSDRGVSANAASYTTDKNTTSCVHMSLDINNRRIQADYQRQFDQLSTKFTVKIIGRDIICTNLFHRCVYKEAGETYYHSCALDYSHDINNLITCLHTCDTWAEYFTLQWDYLPWLNNVSNIDICDICVQ